MFLLLDLKSSSLARSNILITHCRDGEMETCWNDFYEVSTSEAGTETRNKMETIDAFTEKWLIWSFPRTWVGQLNYCLVHFRISLASPQISSFVCGSIHLHLFSLRNMTHLSEFNHALTPATNTTLKIQTRIFSNEANKKNWVHCQKTWIYTYYLCNTCGIDCIF